MIENKLSPSFSDEEKRAINNAIETLNTLLGPKLVTLTKEERRRLPKIDDHAVPMLEKVAHYVETNPEFVMPYDDTELFKRNHEAFGDLREFLRAIEQIVSGLDDSLAIAGSETDEFARRYYSSVGQAVKAGVPDARTIRDDLRKRYETLIRGRAAKRSEMKK